MNEYGVLRWRQAKQQLQRLPSGQQISHVSGSSSCCFYFQTQKDTEEFLFPHLCSGFRQKTCRKGQSLTNFLMEAGRYGCALGQVCTYSDHGHHRYSRHFGWSLLVLKCYRLQQALAFKGCLLIPIVSKQNIIWKQEVWEILKMPKHGVSKWLSRLSKHGKDDLINGHQSGTWQLSLLFSVPVNHINPLTWCFLSFWSGDKAPGSTGSCAGQSHCSTGCCAC